MTCAQCRHTGGWLEDEATGKPVGRCPCMHRTVTGPAAAADAHPQALGAALRIIEHAAKTLASFSANNILDEIEAAQVPGPVVGNAFSAAAKKRWIEFHGQYEPSLKPGTHGHPIKRWESRLYRIARRTA